MRRLGQQFPDALIVISVHSAKFPAEKATGAVRDAARRHGIENPVVNDADFAIWQRYAVRAWPTLVLIDPRGYIVGMQSGEIRANDFAPIIADLVEKFAATGVLDRRPLDLQAHESAPLRALNFPGKLLAAGDGRLFVADTGHHRIVELRLDAGGKAADVVRIFGSGQAALRDGPASEAAFHSPYGMALQGSTLYVADTENHAVRAIDLGTGHVRTVAGTGEKGEGRIVVAGPPTQTPLRSPWAVCALGEIVWIAMAGSHQIWALVNETRLGVFAGNGREALVDGPRADASFNQPSDLARAGGYLFVADAEASAVRAVSLAEEPTVQTLVGQGLFAWGDVDGAGSEVRLQHPAGLTFHNGLIYVADSYNHKIKTLDPATRAVRTLLGTGAPGAADGPFDAATLYEPEGISAAGKLLFIADTNHHAVRVADLTARTVWTLDLRGLEPPRASGAAAKPTRRLDAVTVGPGTVEITLDLTLPPGAKFNPEAPATLTSSSGNLQTSSANGALSLTITATDDREVLFDLTVPFCTAGDESLCFWHQARLVVPLRVAAGGPASVRVPYRVPENGL